MGYFQIGLLVASIVALILLFLPFRQQARVMLAESLFEETMVGEAFETFSAEDPDLEDLLMAAFFGTFLWVLLVALIFGLLWLLWPLFGPSFIITIIIIRRYNRQ